MALAVEESHYIIGTFIPYSLDAQKSRMNGSQIETNKFVSYKNGNGDEIFLNPPLTFGEGSIIMNI